MRLARHRPRRLPGRRFLARAAVAVVIDQPAAAGACVLLVRRARRAGDPWSGDMAFPGGKQAADDPDNLACAIRETGEEVGVSLARADRIGRLSDRVTRSHRRPLPMVITPYVFRMPAGCAGFTPSHEIEEALWLPLAFPADPANRGTMRWHSLPLPCCDYQGRRIWGLTLLMLDELASSCPQHAPQAF